MQKKSTVKRISSELENEIKRIMEKNNLRFADASKEVARLIQLNRNKKIVREIQF